VKRALVLVAVAAPAAADPDLRVHHAPLAHLRMRSAQHDATAPAAAGTDAADDDAAIPAPLRARTERAADRGIAPSDSAAAVRFRMDLGFGVDGAQRSGAATLAGRTLPSDYDPSRGYGFGDLYMGTHGLVLPSLSTYLAAHATFYDPSSAPPMLTPYDRAQEVQVRSGWAEADGLFEEKWLQPLRIRAGRQYVYGPAPAHIDGVVVGYETRVYKLHLFGGTRVPDWDLSGGTRDQITGADARLDLMAWKQFPAVIDGSAYHWGDHDHAELGATVSRGRGLLLRGSARTLDGRLAHENVTAHLRVSDETRVTAELDHRSSYDWRWDPEWVSASEPGAARRYLDLGQVGPRLLANVRAGTVLLDNIDLLLRAAGALDQTRTTIIDTSFASTWGEVGGALEVRLRRTLAFGASAVARKYLRASQPLSWVTQTGGFEAPLPLNPLPNPAVMGESSFLEGGVSARYSLGARKLSATAEIYARRLRWHRMYDVYEAGAVGRGGIYASTEAADTRGGGRFSLEAWVTPRFRLRAEYELSTGLDLAPEILGYKSLRLLAEGSL
jgi:hypothetical protein